jgi:hypothetical protein
MGASVAGRYADRARRALRHLAFSFQDRLQARQSIVECDEPFLRGKDACRGLEAIQWLLSRPDRIAPTGVVVELGGVAGRERFRAGTA